MEISYYDFTNLPDQIQYEMVLSQGRKITENIVSNSRYDLYEFSSFTVEIIYSLSKNKIAGKNIYFQRAAYQNN